MKKIISEDELPYKKRAGRTFLEVESVRMNENTDGNSRAMGESNYFRVDRPREPREQRSDKQLLQSQRLEALMTLVGGIAHDFNNILNVITGHISLMERWRTDPERFKRSSEAVRKATERGANTAKQLMTFARTVDAAMERVNVADVVQEIIDLLKETFPRNLNFEVKIEKGTPAILADSNQIHQALLNLCVNARDAMPGGGTISIDVCKSRFGEMNDSLRARDTDGYLLVTVSDTGSGVEKEILEHIFEPFYTTKGGFGTGLGLAVVYGVMKSHNGFIDVRSTVGKGSSFSLYFPIPSPNSGSALEKSENADLPAGRGETILVIEDEGIFKDFLNTILTEGGYKVIFASNGLDGLQTYKVHKKEIDLVILDMDLPEMSGTEILAGLKLLNPQANIISASGHLESEVEREALNIGARDILAKPYKIEDILQKIDRALRTRPLQLP